MEEIYHTYNRGVEKRKIFLEEKDYLRAVHDFYEFNDDNLVFNLNQRFRVNNGSPTPINLINFKKTREIIVNLIAWCLMPNHYHLFLWPNMDNGISRFHQKFGGGYTNFFNLKYKRSGVLFQGKYKKIQVTNDDQALNLICYIHANPLELWKPNWKEKGLTGSEIQDALDFLENRHRWSSHLDFLGIKNFPSLIDSSSSTTFFNDPKEYREIFTNWLKNYERNVGLVQKAILE